MRHVHVRGPAFFLALILLEFLMSPPPCGSPLLVCLLHILAVILARLLVVPVGLLSPDFSVFH